MTAGGGGAVCSVRVVMLCEMPENANTTARLGSSADLSRSFLWTNERMNGTCARARIVQ